MIVRACEEDWCRVKALRLAALLDVPDAFASTHEREVAQDEGWWRARLRAPHAITLVVKRGDEDAGIATVTRDESTGDAWLFGVWVAPEHRGNRVGDALIEASMAEARRMEAPRLKLDVGDWNTPAQRLYRRHGFVPTGARSTLPPPREDRIELEFERRL